MCKKKHSFHCVVMMATEAIDDIVFGAIDDVKNGNIGIDEITMWGG